MRRGEGRLGDWGRSAPVLYGPRESAPRWGRWEPARQWWGAKSHNPWTLLTHGRGWLEGPACQSPESCAWCHGVADHWGPRGRESPARGGTVSVEPTRGNRPKWAKFDTAGPVRHFLHLSFPFLLFSLLLFLNLNLNFKFVMNLYSNFWVYDLNKLLWNKFIYL
jgi:hypothetical protein